MPASILLQSSPPVLLPLSQESCHSLTSPSSPPGQTRPAKSSDRRAYSWNASRCPPAFHLGEVNDGSDYSLKKEKKNFQTHFGASGETRQPTKNDCGGKSGAGSAQTRSDGRVNERRLGFFKTLVRSSFFFPSLEQFRLIEGMSV